MIRAVEKVVGWLRAGYPQGIPERDFVPLVAVLRRRLTPEEIDQLGRDMVVQGMVPADHIDIGTGFISITDELASFEEIERIRLTLAEAGWDVQNPGWRED